MSGTAAEDQSSSIFNISAYWKKNQRRLAPWLFLSPGILMFLIYVIGPILESIWISFYDWDGLSQKTWFGMGTVLGPIFDFFRQDVFISTFSSWFSLMTMCLIWLILALVLLSKEARTKLVIGFAVIFAALLAYQVLIPSFGVYFSNADVAQVASTNSATWVGLKNYVELFSDANFYTSLWNNVIWLVFFMLAIPIGLFIAIFLNQTVTGIRFYKSMFFFPFVISQVVVGLMFSWFYAPNFGILYQFIEWLTGSQVALLADPDKVTYALVAAGLWPQIAYCMILYLTGLNNVSPDQVEAARLDGAKGWKMLWYVILPQLRPATFIALVVTVIGALRSFDIVSIMTDGGPFGSSRVLSFYMYEQALSEYGYRMGYGAAIAVILFAIMMIFITGFIWKMVRDERGV